MWMVKKLNLWRDIELEQAGLLRLPIPVSLQQPEAGEIGFLSVFTLYADALKAANGKENLVQEIQEVK